MLRKLNSEWLTLENTQAFKRSIKEQATQQRFAAVGSELSDSKRAYLAGVASALQSVYAQLEIPSPPKSKTNAKEEEN